MSTSPLPNRFSGPRHTTAGSKAKKAAEFESIARLVEGLIPNFKDEVERRFYREVVESYRSAAHDILRKAWSDNRG